MNGITSELAGLAFFMITGWVALWPARRTLGPAAYHLAALPTGLLAGPLAAAISSALGRPLDVPAACAGAVLLAVGLQLMLRTLGTPPARPRAVGIGSFLVAAGSMGALAAAFAFTRLTVTNSDSVMSYWPLGVELARKGVLTAPMLSTRNVLVPAMNAIYHSFGSDWAYVIYPMLGVTLLGWLWASLMSGPLASAKRRTAWGVAGVAVLALVLEPSFLFHSVFAHSDMVSAVYLLLSLTCVWLAAPPAAAGVRERVDDTYLVLAGAFAAGLALGRPDGLAYVVVPMAAAIAVMTRSKVEMKSVCAFFGPFVFVIVAFYTAAYAQLGLWKYGKLSGKRTLAVLGVLAFTPAGPWIVSWLDRRLPFRVAGERFLAVFVSGAAVAMLAAFALRWGVAREALANAWINLFAGAGGYNYLWWAVVALLVISVLTRDALRADSWTRSPFLSVLLFFVVAGVVHGVAHAGRVGTGDSLNRVAFHVLPVVVWYVAAVVARIIGDKRPAEAPTG